MHILVLLMQKVVNLWAKFLPEEMIPKISMPLQVDVQPTNIARCQDQSKLFEQNQELKAQLFKQNRRFMEPQLHTVAGSFALI